MAAVHLPNLKTPPRQKLHPRVSSTHPPRPCRHPFRPHPCPEMIGPSMEGALRTSNCCRDWLLVGLQDVCSFIPWLSAHRGLRVSMLPALFATPHLRCLQLTLKGTTQTMWPKLTLSFPTCKGSHLCLPSVVFLQLNPLFIQLCPSVWTDWGEQQGQMRIEGQRKKQM